MNKGLIVIATLIIVGALIFGCTINTTTQFDDCRELYGDNFIYQHKGYQGEYCVNNEVAYPVQMGTEGKLVKIIQN